MLTQPLIDITRTDSSNLDFQDLVTQLDSDLAIRNGETNDFFVQYNKIDAIANVVVVSFENQAIGCGAMKKYDNTTMEIKRMFVSPQMRGKGIAVVILKELEQWAKELGYNKCILETGIQMPEAIKLYQKSQYSIIPNYGQYKNIASSICFEKSIS